MTFLLCGPALYPRHEIKAFGLLNAGFDSPLQAVA